MRCETERKGGRKNLNVGCHHARRARLFNYPKRNGSSGFNSYRSPSPALCVCVQYAVREAVAADLATFEKLKP
ncbi:hypothetical protein GWI33_000344 [Rhynchophorus ferrugineus]|uniref:Uncharacterized protein n=1 Tax=Rhynchophorus ferrugineus TaxID=354439 RepID=A0A834HZI0_RHYFE|nr:hypothetical protein GWI33_000344 [Rhynchophorus ferrugineus]